MTGSKLRHLTAAVVAGAQDPRGIAMSTTAGMSSIRSCLVSAERRQIVAFGDREAISIRSSSPTPGGLAVQAPRQSCDLALRYEAAELTLPDLPQRFGATEDIGELRGAVGAFRCTK